MARAGVIAASLAEQELVWLLKKPLLDAAEIYQFDLLDGYGRRVRWIARNHGWKYALLAGEDAGSDSYPWALPSWFSRRSSSRDKVGAILALADKLDTLLSFFSVDLIHQVPMTLMRFVVQHKGIVRSWMLLVGISLWMSWLTAFTDFHLIAFHMTIKQKSSTSSKRVWTRWWTHQKTSKTLFLLVQTLSWLICLKQLKLFQKLRRPMVIRRLLSPLACFNLAEKADASVAVDASLFENDQEKPFLKRLKSLNWLVQLVTIGSTFCS